MDEDFKIVLVKHITGQATKSETAEIKCWIKASPQNEAYYIELYEAWHASLASAEAINVNKAYDEFISRNSKPLQSYSLWRKLALAAVFLCICAIGLYKVNSNSADEAFVQIAVEKGQTEKLILPDGSTVWVNAGTVIKYSKAFGNADRTVYLNGEAYFDIAKSEKKIPFLVQTANFTIRDIGTIFNVKAYADERIFEATVVEGKISVEGGVQQSSSENSKVFVDANQVLKIDLSEGSSSKIDREVAIVQPKISQITKSQQIKYNGWIDSVLVFDEDSFEEIACILGRRYNVDILLADDDLKRYKYTGTFKNIHDVLKVLKVISENTPITYTKTGTLITISKDNITN